MHHRTHSKTICKWIMDLGAIKHIISLRSTFNTYVVIILHNIHLDNDSVVKAIEIEFIVVEVVMRGKINRLHIKYVFHVPKS